MKRVALALLIAPVILIAGPGGWEPWPSGTPALQARAIEVRDSVAIATAFRVPGNYQILPGTYRGNFVVSADDVTVEATGVRFEPEDRGRAALTILGSRVRITGLVVANGAPDRDTINVGANGIATLEELPRDVTLVRVTAEAGPNGGHRGFGLHGIDIKLLDCRATGFWENGRDSQAIWINNGPGPYLVEGGYFEASGENIMVGGALFGIRNPAVIPSDITIRHAHLKKPLEWQGGEGRPKRGTVKNLFELKAGQRVLVEDCLLENNWKDGQAGSAILIKADNQEGVTPWVVTRDVTFRRNVIRNSPDSYVVNIRGIHPASPTRRTANVTFEHNLFVGVTNGIQAGDGVGGLRVVRNTFLTITGTFLNFYGTGVDQGGEDEERARAVERPPAAHDPQRAPIDPPHRLPDRPRPSGRFRTPLTFVGNVLHSGAYGVKGEGKASGIDTLEYYAQVLDFSRNVIERGSRAIPYPPGNTIVGPGALLGLLDPSSLKYPGDAGY
ncbi:MAG TPA: right-handed parallel beta-helix repeat-containing protein [Vicinamibacterales bacterium]|nr:right-handed parallel beta-helix repeat-containing protein [Acidobacteriota bacterium]HOC18548.1 right-handed parallel beta-helix repeat-containing protein [Vicinamibacterales bacterium]